MKLLHFLILIGILNSCSDRSRINKLPKGVTIPNSVRTNESFEITFYVFNNTKKDINTKLILYDSTPLNINIELHNNDTRQRLNVQSRMSIIDTSDFLIKSGDSLKFSVSYLLIYDNNKIVVRSLIDNSVYSSSTLLDSNNLSINFYGSWLELEDIDKVFVENSFYSDKLLIDLEIPDEDE